MRWVPAAAQRPHRCAFLPTLGANHPRGYFKADGAFRDFDGTVHVSVVAAEMMAKQLGYVSRVELKTLVSQLEAERVVNTELGDVIRDLQRRLDAVQVLKSTPEGFVQQRAPGRPRKEVAA